MRSIVDREFAAIDPLLASSKRPYQVTKLPNREQQIAVLRDNRNCFRWKAGLCAESANCNVGFYCVVRRFVVLDRSGNRTTDRRIGKRYTGEGDRPLSSFAAEGGRCDKPSFPREESKLPKGFRA